MIDHDLLLRAFDSTQNVDMKKMTKWIWLPAVCTLLAGCGQKKTDDGANDAAKPPVQVVAPAFDADSAYAYVARQVDFGPRVPGSEAHTACATYLTEELKRHGATVTVQEAEVTAYDGRRLTAKNIIGAFAPERTRRILLCAHWDSRPFADRDPDKARQHAPIDGADDGASGVGVLLEIARQLGSAEGLPADVGVDIVLFDTEDGGTPAFDPASNNPQSEATWCLGSQHWSRSPHTPGYTAEYGILLDMVGSREALFYRERTSDRYAAAYVDRVWTAARDLGYGRYFVNAPGGNLVDDHVHIIRGLRIPCIDIVNFDPERSTGFGTYWHTGGDTMDNIDRATLRAVGQTVLYVIKG